MKRVILAGFALSLSALLLSPGPSQAQDGRCLAAGFVIAKARAERPSTEIVAQHTGADAAALLEAFNNYVDGEDADAAGGDEITVLRSARSDELLVVVADEGCLVWRAEFSRSQYEHATWKAFGLPI